jgi:hypothetical protein
MCLSSCDERLSIKNVHLFGMNAAGMIIGGMGTSTFNSEAMSYSLNLKTFALSVGPDSCTPSDGSLALVGTG